MVRQFERDGLRGTLHPPAGEALAALALTHGAGGDSSSPSLLAVAEAFARRGVAVLRFDLPFRVQRPAGPPHPAKAGADRAGIAAAVAELRGRFAVPVLAGGHSYGGRQSSMLAAADPGVVDGLVLLAYPLHPPGKPERLRVEHLPDLRCPAAFAHGDRDPFGSVAELEAAVALIPSRTAVRFVAGAGHDLGARAGQAAEAALAAAGEVWGWW